MMLHERLLGYAEEASIEGGYPAISMAIEEELCLGSSRDIEIKIFTAIAEEIERDYIPKSDHEKAINAMVEAQSGVNEPGHRSAHYVMQEYAKSKVMPFEDGDCITDWLNRWFVPRPRYEDGAPVQFGVMVTGEVITNTPSGEHIKEYTGNVICYQYDNYNGVQLELELENGDDITVQGVEGGYEFKRPDPKVLDAEGVEVKVGDTVWRLSDSTKWEVVKLHRTEPRISVRQLDTYKDVTGGWFIATDYSHHEPDTIEKTMERFKSILEDHDGLSYEAEDELLDVHRRLTALIERGA